MADQFQPTSFGQKVGKIGATLWGTDPIYSQLPTRSGYQQAAQMGALPLALGRLVSGFGAPSIAPIAREEQRRFREEVVPGLMEQFAGGGSQGALLRGIQGAGSDLMSRLGALQQQQQFELQKQRQEQLPRLLELGLAPSFQPHLTNRPIQNLPETLSAQIAETPEGQQFLTQAGLGGREALSAGARGIEFGRTAARVPGIVGQDIGEYLGRKGAPYAQRYAPNAVQYVKSVLQRAQKGGLAGAKPEVARRIEEKFKKKLPRGINQTLAAQLRPEHEAMIEKILGHRRSAWKQALMRMTTIPQLEELYTLASGRKPKRSTLNNFLKSLGKAK